MTNIRKPYPDIEFINEVTHLMEIGKIEFVLGIINRSFDKLSHYEKKLLSKNIEEMVKQYGIDDEELTMAYHDFKRSNKANLVVIKGRA